MVKKLTLVTTPIGNKSDITDRAKEKLQESRVILSEDTREIRKLLEILNIDASEKQIYSFNDHDQENVSKILSKLNVDEVLFVSDAGSPIVSDPAFPLVKYFIDNNLELDTMPGVSAPIAALELSGLAPHPFTFHGFLGRKESEIAQKFNYCQSLGGTHLFFEAPTRIIESLSILAKCSPEASVSVCREITKLYQSVYRFKAQEYKSQAITEKGEFVLVVNFGEKKLVNDGQFEKLAQAYMDKKTPKNLSKLLAQILNKSVDEIYQELGSLK